MRLIAWIALGVIAVLVLLFIFLPVVAWILVGLALLILLLVLFVPIGADVAYLGGEFSLAARADGLAIKLYPRKPRDPDKPPKEKKEKKPKKEKPPKEPKPEEEGEKKKKISLDFTFDEIMELAKKAIHGLGKFGKLTVHKFLLHYVAAGKDPYNTAVTFNYVNAALSILWPICAQKFRVKGDVDVWTDIDFTTEKMRIDAELSITLRLAQFVHVGLAVGFGALGVLIKHKIRLRKEKKAAAKELPQADVENTITEDPSTTIQDEERKDSHG